jgi:hypothetical protein
MGGTEGDVTVRAKWTRLGLLLTALHFGFLLLVVGLLEVDLVLAIVVAVGVSVVGGIALTVFVLYVY